MINCHDLDPDPYVQLLKQASPWKTQETGGHINKLCSCACWAMKSTPEEPCCSIFEKNFGQTALTVDAKQSGSGVWLECWRRARRVSGLHQDRTGPAGPHEGARLGAGEQPCPRKREQEDSSPPPPFRAQVSRQAALWNRNYFFRFRFWLLKSYGSGSGSNFWKVTFLVPVPTYEKLRFRFQFRFQLHI